MALHRPTFLGNSHEEFFTPFSQSSGIDPIREEAKRLVDKIEQENSGFILPIPGINLSNLVELLTSVAFGWFDSMNPQHFEGIPNNSKPNILTDKYVESLVYGAYLFLRGLNYINVGNGDQFANVLNSVDAQRLTWLSWKDVDWFGTDWAWMKNVGAKFAIKDWKRIAKALDDLGFEKVIKNKRPKYMWLTDAKQFQWIRPGDPIVAKESGQVYIDERRTWRDLPYGIAWNAIPFAKLGSFLPGGIAWSLVMKKEQPKALMILSKR